MTNASPLTVRFIAEAVAEHHGVSYEALVSAKHGDEAAIPRFLTMWLAHLMTPFTMDDIGRQLGDRDHSAVRRAITTVDTVLLADPAFRSELDVLRIAIVAGAAVLDAMSAKLPGDIDPVALSHAITAGRRRAMNVSTDEIMALALAVLAAHHDREEPAPSVLIMTLLREFLAAEDAAVLAAGTNHAEVPNLKRNHALAALREAFNKLDGEQKHVLAA